MKTRFQVEQSNRLPLARDGGGGAGWLDFVLEPELFAKVPVANFQLEAIAARATSDAGSRIVALEADAPNQAPVIESLDADIDLVSTNSAGVQSDGQHRFPRFSPDGTLIVFDSTSGDLGPEEGGDRDVFIKNLITGEVTLISPETGEHPSFSPDGNQIVYASDNGPEIWLKDLESGDLTLVSVGQAGQLPSQKTDSFDPIFSPDGTKVLFRSTESFDGGSDGTAHLFLKDLSDGSLIRVTTNEFGQKARGGGHDGVFFPDGTKVAFVSIADNLAEGDTNFSADIFVKDLATGDVTRISTDSDGSQIPGAIDFALSPDGTKIAFVTAANLDPTDTSGLDIYLKDLATGVVVLVSGVPGNPINAFAPAFSPDGTKIVFQTDVGTPQQGIWISDLRTGRVVQLSALADTTSFRGFDPLFSPDGTQIAFWSPTPILPGDTNNEGEDLFIATLAVEPVYRPGDVPIVVARPVNVSDADSENFDGGSLDVSISAGAAAGDQLSIANSSAAGFGVEVSGASINYNGGSVGTLTSTDSQITIEFNANADDEAVEAIVEAIRISSSSPTPPDGIRTVTFTLVDGGGTADGGDDRSSFSRDVLFGSGEAPAVARDDAFTTDEARSFGGVVFAENGFGADSDPDGPALAISAVNGSAANVGSQIMLASGALLTVGSDGLFNYDPNDAFDETPVEATGASNTLATDSFTYTLVNGNTATVTITIEGLDSDDLIVGTTGDDILFSDEGHDTLRGRAGDDTYWLNYDSTPDDFDDAIIEAVGGGHDAVKVISNYQLTAGAEVELLQAATFFSIDPLELIGNEFDNVIIGNAGDNILDGGNGGLDRLGGRSGTDQYFVEVGDIVIETAGGGTDTARARTSYVLNAGAEVEILKTAKEPGSDPDQGLTPINLTGNEFAQNIIGNAGQNILDGGAGAIDRLAGLLGDDTYFVKTGDVVLEEAGAGHDVVKARSTYVLGAGVAVEILQTANTAGTALINLTGNEFDNSILGNAGRNILDGGNGGIDRLKGFGGDDVYYVAAGDVVLEEPGGGNDVVKARGSYVLNAGTQVELLQTADSNGTTAINLTGSELANRIIGNDGANVLKGWLGSDFLLGNGGADRFVFNAALGPNNVDKILDFVAGVDEIGLDDAVFTGLTPGALPANAFAIGSSASDADDRIIYNSATGALLFDTDGNGAGAAVQFATLDPGLALTAGDFVVI